MKHFSAFNREGTSFGMDVETNTPAYRAMKKNTALHAIFTPYGGTRRVRACPYQYVAAIMREAGWLVSEAQSFKWFTIDAGDRIYIIYPDGIHT